MKTVSADRRNIHIFSRLGFVVDDRHPFFRDSETLQELDEPGKKTGFTVVL